MERALAPVVLVLLLAALTPAVRAQEAPGDGPLAPPLNPAWDLVANALRPSVVHVITTEGSGGASGLMVDGGVVTNAHVVAGAAQVELVTSDGTHVLATVSRTDVSRDLALLTTVESLPAAELESTAAQVEGDQVIVLGYAQETSGPALATSGTISAIANLHGVDMLLTDAAITPFSFSSPVINARGKVVGLMLLPSPAYNQALGAEVVEDFLAGAPPVDDFFLRRLSGLEPLSNTSRNWTGYAATGGQFSAVSAGWVVPLATPSAAVSVASTWVGIGGIRSNDLIEAGTQATSRDGQVMYEAWLELLPASSRSVPLAVHPGDTVTVSLTQKAAGTWVIGFVNSTTGQTLEQTEEYASSLSSAEWMQGLASSTRTGTLLGSEALTSVSFAHASTIRGGRSQSLSEAATGVVTLVGDANQPLVTVSPIDATGSGFTITRIQPQPAPSSPVPTPSAAGPTLLFHGSPYQIVVQPGELVGTGWRTAETRLDPANEYSSGRLSVVFAQGGSRSPGPGTEVDVEVFRDVLTADAAFKHVQTGRVGGPVGLCDADWLSDFVGSATLHCREANVEILLVGPTAELDRAALDTMLKRLKPSLAP